MTRATGTWLAVLAALGSALVLTGCQTVVDTAETVRRIQQETGTFDVQVQTVDPTGGDIAVRYSTDRTTEQAVWAEAERVAEVVWTNLPLRVDEVAVQPRGAPAGVQSVVLSRSELEQRFGPRPEDFQRSLAESVLPFVVTALVVLALVVVIVVILVRRFAGRPAPGDTR